MKKIMVLFLLSAIAGAVLAQEAVQQEPVEIALEETITAQDLGVSEPGLLPTSPFYFFKEMTRNLRSFITFNPISKAELELKFSNEKAAEIKKITENQPQNTEAIKKALENYQETQVRLRAKFEGLKGTSQNPKIDELLNKFTEKTVKHEKLFDEISFKFRQKEGISSAIRDTMSESENLIGEAAKRDTPEKFSSRLEKVLLEERGGNLKHARSVEIIDRFSNKSTTEIKESLGKLREEFSERLESDIEDLLEKEGEDAVKEKIVGTPGDFAKRSVIIEEIQKRAEDRIAQVLEKAMGRLESVLQKEADIAGKAKEQIERAEKMIQEVETAISQKETVKIPEVVKTLLTEAKDNLQKAKAAFDEEKYGEAFGQARSSEVLARNALRFFKHEQTPEVRQIHPGEKITPVRLAPITVNCENIKKRIVELKELLTSKRLAESDFKIKYDSYLREIIVCQEEKNVPAPLPPTSVSPAPEVCTLQFDPVCGSNGKTYSNVCHAKNAGVSITHRGECKVGVKTIEPVPVQEIQIQEKIESIQKETISPTR